jgi:hypothetical protein
MARTCTTCDTIPILTDIIAVDLDRNRAAIVELRKDLAGVQEPVGIEGAFEALLLRRVDFESGRD